MSIIVTKEEFLKRAKEKHGEKYSYDKIEYKLMSEKVLITCPEHGDFLQLAESHVIGYGCRKCANIKISTSKTKTTEQFILESKKIHKETYTYDKVNYIGDKNKVIITCEIHGEFEQFPGNHLKGHGCSKCNFDSKKLKINNFLNKANKVHNNFYDYSKIKDKLLGNNTKLLIICPLHGEFIQLQRSHLQGRGCYECARLKFGQFAKSNTKDFITKSIKIHGNLYDYSLVNYINADTKVKIICSIHGLFEQIPRSHLSECGCPECNIYQGYNKSRWVNQFKNGEGILYTLKCWNEEEIFYKIGITGRSVKQRYGGKSALPYSWEIINEVKSKDLNYIWDLEKKEKNRLKNYKYKPKLNFPGSSQECFSLIEF